MAKNIKSKYYKQYNETLKLIKETPTLSITQAVKIACDKTGVKFTEKIRKAINNKMVYHGKGKKLQNENDSANQFKEAQSKSLDKTKETFIITWAQSATPVHSNLWDNIKAYANKKDASIHVIAGRYKNPTSIFTDDQKVGEWWDDKVLNHLDANRHNVHEYLQVLSDVKIQPTASMPLSGMHGITGVESCIVGHPRQHLKSLPVLEGYKPKLLLSTGACTVSNYTDSKAGKKGDFHHVLGFVIVELIDDFFIARHVSADNDGNFYDIESRAYNGTIYRNIERPEAIILGDVHVRHNDATVTNAVFDFIAYEQPKHVIVHDIFEAESILHWDEKSPFRLMEKAEKGLNNLREEIEETMEFIDDAISMFGSDVKLVFSRSNHDDMLDRWLNNSDWRKIDSINKKIYLELAQKLANNKEARRKGILPFLIDERFGGAVKTLSLDDSYSVKGWELSMHGHIGAHGSRGSAGQFKNLNTKNIVGHRHTPERVDGHLAVGTLTHLRVGFNRGPSAWLNGFAIIYPDGKAQLINIINGKFCK